MDNTLPYAGKEAVEAHLRESLRVARLEYEQAPVDRKSEAKARLLASLAGFAEFVMRNS